MELGLRLGADVPVFLFGRNALGEGVGERLQALDLAPAWYLVLTPQVSVSTKEIFSDAALTRDTKPLKMSPFLSGQGRNDLEPIALRRYPEIAEHLAWLRKRSPQGSSSAHDGFRGLRVRRISAARGCGCPARRTAGGDAGLRRAGTRAAPAA